MSDPRHALASALLTRLLSARDYDAADLHLYGCVTDIAAKVQWVRARMPAGRPWISTENGGPDPRCASTPVTWDQDRTRFEERQAQQVPARLGACADNGGRVCLWFSLFDLPGESAPFAHLGLLAVDAGAMRGSAGRGSGFGRAGRIGRAATGGRVGGRRGRPARRSDVEHPLPAGRGHKPISRYAGPSGAYN